MRSILRFIVPAALIAIASLNVQAEDAAKPAETAAPAKVKKAKHDKHKTHTHKHGSADCQHKAEQHGDHTDYEDDGHHHKAHGEHYDECHGPEGDAKAAEAKPADAAKK